MLKYFVFFISVLISSVYFLYHPYSISSRQSVEIGEKVYTTHCWFCHGQKGDGISDAAAVLDPKPKNFTDPDTINYLTPDRMERSIINGRKGTAMPSFKNSISLNEVKSVILYIREIIMKGKRPVPAYLAHDNNFSYIDINGINEKSDLRICLLHCHTDETYIRKRVIALKKKK